jgi:hypothetical protein
MTITSTYWLYELVFNYLLLLGFVFYFFFFVKLLLLSVDIMQKYNFYQQQPQQHF